MTVFACIVCFMLGYLAHKAADMYDRKREKETAKQSKKPKPELQCSDTCEHCIYIEEGDFICDVVQDVRIVDWKPFSCVCPKKRRLNK